MLRTLLGISLILIAEHPCLHAQGAPAGGRKRKRGAPIGAAREDRLYFCSKEGCQHAFDSGTGHQQVFLGLYALRKGAHAKQCGNRSFVSIKV